MLLLTPETLSQDSSQTAHVTWKSKLFFWIRVGLDAKSDILEVLQKRW